MPRRYSGSSTPAAGGTIEEPVLIDPTIPTSPIDLEDPATDERVLNKGQVKRVVNEKPYGTQAGAAYTFAATDVGKYREFTHATAVTATVPPVGTGAGQVAWEVGNVLTGEQGAAGQVTITGGAGVTIQYDSVVFLNKTRGQRAHFQLYYKGANVWILWGNLALV
jgi:hypothetical protein